MSFSAETIRHQPCKTQDTGHRATPIHWNNACFFLGLDVATIASQLAAGRTRCHSSASAASRRPDGGGRPPDCRSDRPLFFQSAAQLQLSFEAAISQKSCSSSTARSVRHRKPLKETKTLICEAFLEPWRRFSPS